MVRGKWLTAQMWAHYINKNHPLSDSYIVYAVMLHHDVSYDPTLRHLDLYGKVNDRGVYHHFVTYNNTSILHCYQVRKKGEARNFHKVKTGYFWSKGLYNPFTQNLGLEAQFESSDNESDTKYDRTTNTNMKEGGKCSNRKVTEPDVEIVDVSGDDALQGFVS